MSRVLSEEEKLFRLKRRYKREGLVLALGAGVSLGSNLPSWFELVQNLAKDSIAKGDSDYVKALEQWSLPVIASVLEQNCSEEQKDIEPRVEFVERVRKELYRKFYEALYPDFHKALYLDAHEQLDSPLGPVMDVEGTSEERKKAEENRRKLVRHISDNNKTLRAVAALCTVQYADKEKPLYKANVGRIRAIVTFNLDHLLQEYTRARYNQPGLLRTIERATQSPHIGKISVYHMHGLLRFDNKAKQSEKEAADAVVLTEQDYFNFFNEPMSLFNYTFLYLLREYSCLFIGLSMQDENIRRLLHYSREERRQSYLNKHPNESEDDAIKERVESHLKKRTGNPDDDAIEELVRSLQHHLKKTTSETEDKAIERSCRHFAILQHSNSTATDDAVENSLLALGTHVLWIADYDQIPTLLANIYPSGSYEWDQVY